MPSVCLFRKEPGGGSDVSKARRLAYPDRLDRRSYGRGPSDRPPHAKQTRSKRQSATAPFLWYELHHLGCLVMLTLPGQPEIRHANSALGLDEFMMRGTLQDGLWDHTQLDDCGAAELLVPIGTWAKCMCDTARQQSRV
jgi:hypothetical protein